MARHGAISFTLDNPNPYAVTFDKITAMTVASDDTAECPSSHVSVPAASTASPYTISDISRAANAAASAASISGLVSMAQSAPDGCQGKTFTVTLTLSGSQS